MRSKAEWQESEEWQIFAEYWALFKKWYEPEEKTREAIDRHIDGQIDEVSAFMAKYKGTDKERLVVGLCNGMNEYFDVRSKGWNITGT